MPEPIRTLSRREFVRGSLLVAGALTVPQLLAACSKKSAPPTTAGSLAELLNARKRAGAAQGLSVFLGGEDYIKTISNYVAFGMAEQAGQPIIGSNATVWVAQGAGGEGAPRGPFTADWAPYTKPDAPPLAPQGLNHAEFSFDQPGVWQMLVEVQTTSGRVLGTSAIQVKETGKASTRVPDQRAIASQTPTVGDARGVHPICTRTPPCPFHQITLAKALTLSKPTAFFVGTPKFCMSRTCGPNLEELIGVANEVGDRVSFVHAEVYRSDKAEDIQRQAASPTFAQWGFQSEPWMFLIDRNGIIAKRFEGPVVKPIIMTALQPLIG
jgi:hypothetical protein